MASNVDNRLSLASGAESRALVAYEIYSPNGMDISTAPTRRDWMDETDQRFAYRCLPLMLANSAGWLISCPCNVSVWWSGGSRKEDLFFSWQEGTSADSRIQSHFGHGILTFSLPYLFRTPNGVNLWVRGPTNSPKDGIHALDGIVETDWAAATFTMNWKLTRPNHVVSFRLGEPICMIIPVSRGFAEGFSPARAPLQENPELLRSYKLWDQTRAQFLRSLHSQEPEAVRRGWEKDYFKGATANGEIVREHQTKLELKEFKPFSK